MSDALRQAAEQALDALNTCDPFGYDGHRVSEAINALHAALYAPQQAEPPVEPTVVRIVSYGPDNRYGYRYDPDDAATHIAPGEALAVIKWPTPPADARITDDMVERACYRPGELDDLYRMRAIAAPQQAEPPDDGVRRAAADVISAWDAHGTPIALRGWIDILRQRLAETPAPAAPPADARITDDMVERACIAFSEAFWFYETRGGAKVRSMAIKAALRAALEGGR
jgi:hypothetical protein